MEALKPCPFCGGEAHTLHVGDWWVEHACKKLGTYIRTRFCETEEEAVAWWNTRKWKTCRLELEEPNEDGVWWCSYCKSYHQHKSKYPLEYCPRCGAKVVDE